ncbi:MAG: ABC transporter permease [Anaerolineae bacterium]|nr:ABC transporter permease [Anaerolineae bacterium]
MNDVAEITQTQSAAAPTDVFAEEERREGYFELVWQRFKKSKAAIVGGLMVLALAVLAAMADFFTPVDPSVLDMKASFTPPSRIHFIDADGHFHLRPFVYNLTIELDPKTYQPIWTEDTSQRYEIKFFVKSWEYKLFGIIPTRLHLFGVDEGGTIYLLGTDKMGRDLWGRSCLAGRVSLTMGLFATFISISVGSVLGVVSGYYGGWIDTLLQRFVEFMNSFPQLPLWMALTAVIPKTWGSGTIFMMMAVIFALLSWTVLAREVRGKAMAFRETDFILAAKEMGASDLRIIFVHLYPNCLSHVIVVLTLMIPQIILAEAFLSFLGLGIQEPLVSWGFLMKNAQNLQTLGVHPWIMSPVVFIIIAVLGFNFLGDGLRDAADPYSII